MNYNSETFEEISTAQEVSSAVTSDIHEKMVQTEVKKP